MSSYKLFNQSSESMGDVVDESVDLILAGPPYNIGTVYSTNTDQQPVAAFHEMLKRIFAECARVLKPDGRFVVECADTTYADGIYTSLAGLVQKIISDAGLTLTERHVSFTLTEKGIEKPEHGWREDFTTKGNTHSNCHQILVFQKVGSFQEGGRVLYYNYPANEEGHPCPYSPQVINFILNRYFMSEQTVLDPFMGTGRLGREVVKRSGNFIGYELEKKFFDTATRLIEEPKASQL